MNEKATVEKANESFYRAFESLSVSEMEKVWLQAGHIKCVHPGWPLLWGWGPIMASWDRIFANTFEMRFTLTDVRVEVLGSLAWVVLIENLESRTYDSPSRSTILATNIYENYNRQWFLVHHHASPVFNHLPDGGKSQLQ
jgi:ketosteroid isomerase-like protein